MNTKANKHDEEYEGADKATVVVGQAKIYGWAGSIIGTIVGAIVSATTAVEHAKFTEKAQALFSAANMPIKGRTAIIAGVALAGGFFGQWIGMAIGAARHIKNAGRGREQFERIKAERDEAMANVEIHNLDMNEPMQEESAAKRESEASHIEGFISRTEQGGHTAAYIADKDTNPPVQVVR